MIAWFARNGIAANFLMAGILLGGIYCALYRLPLEIEPGREWGMVAVTKSYPGATPWDVANDLLVPVEKALAALDGVAELRSYASPGMARLEVWGEKGVDLRFLQEEVRSRLQTVGSIPAPEEPFGVNIPSGGDDQPVIWVAVSGDLQPDELRAAARQVRDDLETLAGVGRVTVSTPDRRELSVALDSGRLSAYNLSFQEVADAIRNFSLDLSAGVIEHDGGTLAIRTRGRAGTLSEFARIPLRSGGGAELTLADVATISEDEESAIISEFNRRPAIRVDVFRDRNASALKLAREVRAYVANAPARYPDGVHLAADGDRAVALQSRLQTMTSSLLQGGLLVLVVLGLFLRPRLAFWVVAGIPVSFAGGLIALSLFGFSINMMSLFGFIIVIGVVVDDAIVTGESVHARLLEGVPPLQAAIDGTRAVTVPVTFGVLTTIVAFIPLMFLEGMTGAFARQIPVVVAPVLLFSLLESKLILPSHLKHLRPDSGDGGRWHRFHRAVQGQLDRFIRGVYGPCLGTVLAHRFSVLALFVAMALLLLGVFAGGRLGYVRIPSIELPVIYATLELPDHATPSETLRYMDRLTAAAEGLREDFKDPQTGVPIAGNTWRMIGTPFPGSPPKPSAGVIFLGLVPPGSRSEPGPSNDVLIERWRERMGALPDNVALRIRNTTTTGDPGGGGGDPLEIELRGPDTPAKRKVADDIVALLRSSAAVGGAWANQPQMREEIELTLKPRALELGVDLRSLASQVRQAFHGEEAQRIQGSDEEILVMVRLPRDQRASPHSLRELRIKGPEGASIPLGTVADLAVVNAPNFIERRDQAEITRIGAEPRSRNTDLLALAEELRPRIRELVAGHDELSFAFTGHLMEAEESQWRLLVGGLALLLALYALLAIPFQSMWQPLVVMLAIPFGAIGALLGHLLLGITPSDLSMFGLLAMAGVVVNDALVMVDDVNKRRQDGVALRAALQEAGQRRFRPIFLTSLTTFVGLLPLMLEDSLQAQFLIPMAVSLAFGVAFATLITLFLIPAALLVSDDLVRFGGRIGFSRKRKGISVARECDS
jgi:multidrug efflux pump subunit AcrB